MSPLDGQITDFVAPVKPAAPDLDLSIFDRAADEIERRGHCQHALQTCGHVCLLGAFNVVHHGDPFHRMSSYEPLVAFSRGLGFTRSTDAIEWNNTPGRTAAEVVDRLRRAARGEFVNAR